MRFIKNIAMVSSLECVACVRYRVYWCGGDPRHTRPDQLGGIIMLGIKVEVASRFASLASVVGGGDR